jgi:hypothetical protein
VQRQKTTSQRLLGWCRWWRGYLHPWPSGRETNPGQTHFHPSPCTSARAVDMDTIIEILRSLYLATPPKASSFPRPSFLKLQTKSIHTKQESGCWPGLHSARYTNLSSSQRPFRHVTSCYTLYHFKRAIIVATLTTHPCNQVFGYSHQMLNTHSLTHSLTHSYMRLQRCNTCAPLQVVHADLLTKKSYMWL